MWQTEVGMQNYWNRRFKEEGRIWGVSPSPTVHQAREAFRNHGVKKILIPGAGYGRHADYFASEGFIVHAVEVSDVAVELAARPGSRVTYFRGSVIDMPFSDDLYDAIYCFNLLHLLLAADRRILIEKCASQLRSGGIAFFVAFSDKEPTRGKGRKVEEETYESKPGRPAHYFTDEDMKAHFAGFDILETGLVEDQESHGKEGPHIHFLRYMNARKR
jgi:SAM-dependent methyltransferase